MGKNGTGEPIYELPEIPDVPGLPMTEEQRKAIAWNLKQGWMGEELVVRVIRKCLLTPADKKVIEDAGYSIEDLLNGRYTGDFAKTVQEIYGRWNGVLGEKEFGA